MEGEGRGSKEPSATISSCSALCSPFPKPLGASELFSLEAEGSLGGALSHGHSLNPIPPTPAPLATATSASGESRRGPPHPCRIPSLDWGACFCSQWHHHPTPQAAQSSGQQLATSSPQHEATERHSPSPASRQPQPECWGCPHTL